MTPSEDSVTGESEKLDDRTEWLITAYRKACQLTPHTDMDVALKELRSGIRELLVSRTEETIPGEWVCPTCSYFESRVVLNPATGQSGPNPEPPLPCPNDGQFMVALTWKQHALDLRKTIDGLLERTLAPEEALALAKTMDSGRRRIGEFDAFAAKVYAKLCRISEAKP